MKQTDHIILLRITNTMKYVFVLLFILLAIHMALNTHTLRIAFRKQKLQGPEFRIEVENNIQFVSVNITERYTCVNNECNDKNISTEKENVRLCETISSHLEGQIKVYTESPTYSDLNRLYPWVEDGGRGKPSYCRPRYRVAIIIPYRNRDSQLRTFLYNIHPFLYKQELDYGVYVVEQDGNSSFNRAALMNIGYTEAKKIYAYQCFIFHDVDLLPENDNNLYNCPPHPRHLSAFIDKFKYRLPYKNIFGGVTALTGEQFQNVNGYSNQFFGWGGEDDDMWNRVHTAGYKVIRNSVTVARYKMIKHGRDAGNNPNPKRNQLIRDGVKNYRKDGLNSLEYKVLQISFRHLFTHLLVTINKPNGV